MGAPPRSAAGGAPAPTPRRLRAPNPSPLTLDGTWTHLVGAHRVAVVDPGPDLPAHVDAIVDAVGGGRVAAILLTHLHPDHAGAAPNLSRRTGAPVRCFGHGTLAEGDVVETDQGPLTTLATPGHTADHAAFHWPAASAVFCGDLMLGGQDSALVAPPDGDLGRYLASLRRLRALEPSVIYPAHGEPFEDPRAALDRYVEHRSERLRQALDALAAGPAGLDTLVDRVYGPALAPGLRAAAAGAMRAYLDHLCSEGRVRRVGPRWELA